MNTTMTKAKTKTTIEIQLITPGDLTEVLEIESLPNQIANPESGVWEEEDFREVLSQATNGGIVVIKSTKDYCEIIGYMIYNFSQSQFTIYNMAVDPNCPDNIGPDMINWLKSKLTDERNTIEVDVRETNLAAQLFFRGEDFKATKVMRRWYKAEQVEDAYKFKYIVE